MSAFRLILAALAVMLIGAPAASAKPNDLQDTELS